MPARTDHDEAILEAARLRGALEPREIAQIAREFGTEFFSSDYSWGWQTARRLVRAQKMVQVAPGRFAAPLPDIALIGMPEVGEVTLDTLAKIKACLLLAAKEMLKAIDEAEGSMDEWLSGAYNRCTRDGHFIGVLIDGANGAARNSSNSSADRFLARR